MNRRYKTYFAWYFMGVAVLAVVYALMPFFPEATWRAQQADAAIRDYAFAHARSRYVAERVMEQWKAMSQVPGVESTFVDQEYDGIENDSIDPSVESLLATIDMLKSEQGAEKGPAITSAAVNTVQVVAKTKVNSSKKSMTGIKVALAAELPAKLSNNQSSQPQHPSSSKKPRGNSIVIPSIKVDMGVFTGTEKVLDKGAWLLPDSANPGQGNTVISAHRYQSFGSKSFYHLDKVHEGDVISVWWNGVEFRYKVTRNFVVAPDQVDVLNKSSQVKLTLITCDPVFSTKNRRIVVAELITE